MADVERLEQSFWGQMSSLYFFNLPLSADVVRTLYDLGPTYCGQFSPDEASQLGVSPRSLALLTDGVLQYGPRHPWGGGRGNVEDLAFPPLTGEAEWSPARRWSCVRRAQVGPVVQLQSAGVPRQPVPQPRTV